MKKYKVYFTAYDNNEWRHRKGNIILEVNSEDEARKIIEDKSNYFEEYFVNRIEVVN